MSNNVRYRRPAWYDLERLKQPNFAIAKCQGMEFLCCSQEAPKLSIEYTHTEKAWYRVSLRATPKRCNFTKYMPFSIKPKKKANTYFKQFNPFYSPVHRRILLVGHHLRVHPCFVAFATKAFPAGVACVRRHVHPGPEPGQ